MKIPTLLLLLVTTVQLTSSCDPYFHVQSIAFGSYRTARYSIGAIISDVTDDYFGVPIPVFDTLMDKLSAQDLLISCDDASVGSYPNLTYYLNDVAIVVTPNDYIDWSSKIPDENLCFTVFDRIITMPDTNYTIPQGKFSNQICGSENPSTERSTVVH
ncbi:hypothetical protein M3Y94_01030400 [Aphelenchoides besseyi]|nr:hypothetical protein M3Y94_01030400 [Aphelenchoides besseyi]KAI6223905.1 hypothetical protein M3Y95_00826200 [Aphelenchoides besseyi]